MIVSPARTRGTAALPLVFAGVLFLILVLDVAAFNVSYLGFYVVPPLASVVLGRPAVTAALAGLALVAALAGAWVNNFTAEDSLRRFLVLLLTGVVAVYLARVVRMDRRDLAAETDRYRMLAENASDIVFRGSPEAVLEWVSPSVERELGYPPAEMVGHPIRDFLHPDDVDAMAAASRRSNQGVRVECRARFRRRDGSFTWVEVTARPLANPDGAVVARVGSARRIDRQMELERELLERIARDTVTGAVTRDEAQLRLESLAGDRRSVGGATAVLFCDVDHFKEVNDTHGHAAGDAVLREIADRIARQVRDQDTVARFGGDEFVVILASVRSLPDAATVAEKVREAVSRPIAWSDAEILASVSVGVTMTRADEEFTQLVARADEAMYQAKRAGRNTVVLLE